jgi:hypothetical protein
MPVDGVLMKKAISAAGGLEEFRKQSNRYYNDLHYFEEHKDDLMESYDKHWVAIFNADFIAAEKNLAALLKLLRKKDIPEEEAFIQFISSEHLLTLY